MLKMIEILLDRHSLSMYNYFSNKFHKDNYYRYFY